MPKIFINYRREDTRGTTGRICDRLGSHFGKDTVFKDVDSLGGTNDFGKDIVGFIEDSSVMLSIIGKDWLSERNHGRLHHEEDWVRREVETAFELGLLVIPVRVDDAKLPPRNKLPKSLVKLMSCNWKQIRFDPDFHRDLDVLIAWIETETQARELRKQEAQAQEAIQADNDRERAQELSAYRDRFRGSSSTTASLMTTNVRRS